MDFILDLKQPLVIEHRSVLPVAILIHSGAPHDSKLYDEVNGKPYAKDE